MQGWLFEYLHRNDYENLVLCQDRAVGLRAIIAIHDTTLGPATGGTRMWTYPGEREALEDALRLARGMTYKYAAAGVNLAGVAGDSMIAHYLLEPGARAHGRLRVLPGPGAGGEPPLAAGNLLPCVNRALPAPEALLMASRLSTGQRLASAPAA